MNFDHPPGGAGIKLIESSEELLVIEIPPGGSRCRSIGCFGFAWLTITLAGSLIFFLVPNGLWEGGKTPFKIFFLPFFSFFYAVGFGFLYAWLRMRFTKILIAVTADQFALQRSWFNRQKFETVALDHDSLATLIESYRENASPVYTIRIRSADEFEKRIQFATRLSYEEKRWITGTINNYLRSSYGHDLSGHSRQCTQCGAELPEGYETMACEQCGEKHVIDSTTASPSINTAGQPQKQPRQRSRLENIAERPPSIAPSDLPQDSPIRIELNNNETLVFSYRWRISDTGTHTFIFTAIAALFCTIWYGITFAMGFVFFNNNENRVFAFIPVVAFLVGLLPLSVLVSLFRGRGRIKIDRERFSGSLRALVLQKTVSVSSHSIEDVGISTSAVNTRSKNPLPTHKTGSCVVKSSERNMLLTYSSDSSLNYQLAGLVRNHLEHIGINLNSD